MPIPLKNIVSRPIEKLFEHSVLDCGINPSDKLLVAVSGGLDSTVLAHLCQQINLDFHLIHMNYGLRGAESDGDEFFCYELSKKLNRPFHHRNVKNEISESTPNLQAVARELRYNWFGELLTEYNSKWVLTGHHFDDHAETLIHQFIRGGGPNTLTGFYHSRLNVARPLMNFRRSEILQYAQVSRIEWREDQSNFHNDYTRNKIRHSLLPVLKEYNNGLENSLIQRAKAVHDIIEYAKLSIQRELGERLMVKESMVSVDVKWLRCCSYQELFIRSWCNNAGITDCDTDAVMQLLTKERGELKVGEKIFRLTADSLQLMASPKPLRVNTKVDIPFRYEGHNIIVELVHSAEVAHPDPWARIDKKWLEGKIILRNWRPADRFVPSGMKGSKKVGDFLTHQKIPLSERARILVLEKDGEILAVLGHRLSERVWKLQEPESAIAIYLR
ncbi:MAG: tRNA lysidine(34) synthetase TilS [Flavobacteriales bacterium]